MKKPVLFGIIFVVAVLAVIVYSTLNLAKYRVEVCIDFNGRTQCRTASGDSEEHAQRSAASNACAMIASGMTDSIACEHTEPKSVRWLKQ